MSIVWNVIPFEKVGPLKFGMPRDEVRSILGSGFTTFQKVEGPRGLVDRYQGTGLFLFYNDDGGLRYVEAHKPCIPNYRGVSLKTNGADHVLSAMKAIGEIPRRDSLSYYYEHIGIMLYVPDSSRLELIGLCSRDEMNAIIKILDRSAAKRTRPLEPPEWLEDLGKSSETP